MDTSKEAVKSSEMSTSVESENEPTNVGAHGGTVMEFSSDESSSSPMKTSAEPDDVTFNPSAYSSTIPEDLTEETGTTRSSKFRWQVTLETGTTEINIPIDLTMNPKIVPEEKDLEASTVELTIVPGTSKTSEFLKDAIAILASVPKEISVEHGTVSKGSPTKVGTAGIKEVITDFLAHAGIIETETHAEAGTNTVIKITKDGTILKEATSKSDSLSKDPTVQPSTSSAEVSTGSKGAYPGHDIVSKEQTAVTCIVQDETKAQSSDSTSKLLMYPLEMNLHSPGSDVAELSTSHGKSKSLSLDQIRENAGQPNTLPSEANIHQHGSLPFQDSETKLRKAETKSHEDSPSATAIADPYTGDNRKETKSRQSQFNLPGHEKVPTDFIEANRVATVPLHPSTASSSRKYRRGHSMPVPSDYKSLKFQQVPEAISPLPLSDNEDTTETFCPEDESSEDETGSYTFSPIQEDSTSSQPNYGDFQHLGVLPPNIRPGDEDTDSENIPHDIPPLVGWIPPTAKRIRPPVAESYPSSDSDTDTDLFPSDSESLQNAPFFNSDSESATDSCSLNSRYQSPEGSQPSSGTTIIYSVERDSSNYPSTEPGVSKLDTSENVGDQMSSCSKDGIIQPESSSKLCAVPMDQSVSQKPAKVDTSHKDMSSNPSTQSKEPAGTPPPNVANLPHPLQAIPTVSTPFNMKVDSTTNLTSSENQSQMVSQPSSSASLPCNQYIDLDTSSMRMEYKELEIVPSPLLEWMPIFKGWTAPTARWVPTTEIQKVPASVEHIIFPDRDSTD